MQYTAAIHLTGLVVQLRSFPTRTESAYTNACPRSHLRSLTSHNASCYSAIYQLHGPLLLLEPASLTERKALTVGDEVASVAVVPIADRANALQAVVDEELRRVRSTWCLIRILRRA